MNTAAGLLQRWLERLRYFQPNYLCDPTRSKNDGFDRNNAVRLSRACSRETFLICSKKKKSSCHQLTFHLALRWDCSKQSLAGERLVEVGGYSLLKRTPIDGINVRARIHMSSLDTNTIIVRVALSSSSKSTTSTSRSAPFYASIVAVVVVRLRQFYFFKIEVIHFRWCTRWLKI